MNSRREAVNGVPYKIIFHNVEEKLISKSKGSRLNLVENESTTNIDVFIKGYPIRCHVYRVDDLKKKFPHNYYVDFTHGNFKWTLQKSYQNAFNFNAKIMQEKFARGISLPKFPMYKPVQSEETKEKLMKDLGVYLEGVLNHPFFRNNKSVLKFMEVSWLSFIDDLGQKHKEGYVKKKAGNQHPSGEISGAIHTISSKIHTTWTKNWLVVKDNYLVIVRPTDNLIREVLLMDHAFHVNQDHRNYMKISNLNRSLVLKCRNSEELAEWMAEINKVANKAEDFIQPNRLDSFAPVRRKILAKWFVDGSSYFEKVADILDGAREEIYITDWMLSPELYLKRPITDDTYWRLDNILQRKAEQGVNIFVIIFEDVKIAMGLDSIYTKRRLQALHKNIKVLRRRGFAQIMFWSPHDKMVIVDQQFAFFGGLDMCFGRWDDHIHKLTDPRNADAANQYKPKQEPEVTRSAKPQILTSFISYTSSTDSSLKEDKDSVNYSSAQIEFIPDGTRWPGKDYMNFIYKDFQHVDFPFDDLIDRTEMPRMPWHDIACFVQGYPARDLARHFIQRWNVTKLDVRKEDTSYPLLLPKGHGTHLNELKPALTLMTRVDCQMLRSACNWSAGIQDTEHSIHNAYMKVISEAEHFIYIENQFFVSLMGGHPQVLNKIADCLFERILRAHTQQTAFKVYVVMPLLPGIEGDIKSESGVAIKAVTHYNYASICRGPHSLWSRLQSKVGNPANYLTFCALRTYELTQDNMFTELVYVHSKLMIADDRVAIVGSANINDRSMSGDRDCEIAAIYEDRYELENTTFAGRQCQVGRFVSSLRQHIFREHLGMIENPSIKYDLSDPVSDEFFCNVWQKVASKNTKIFEEVFRCIPNDSITNISELESYSQKTIKPSLESVQQNLKEIEGHLVLLPFYFLCKEDLAPAINTKEGIMPNILWT